jgi:hypothetical protein
MPTPALWIRSAGGVRRHRGLLFALGASPIAVLLVGIVAERQGRPFPEMVWSFTWYWLPIAFGAYALYAVSFLFDVASYRNPPSRRFLWILSLGIDGLLLSLCWHVYVR